MEPFNQLDKLAPALVALQASLTPVAKSEKNPFFNSKFAPLSEIMRTVQPLLAEHKLAVSQFPTSLNGTSAFRTILLHESGQSIEDVTPLLLTKQDPQGQGSAITYARRYGIMSVLGIVADDDDDGNAASNRLPARQVESKASTNQKELIFKIIQKKGVVGTDNIKTVFLRLTGRESMQDVLFDEASKTIDKLQAMEPDEVQELGRPLSKEEKEALGL